MLVNIDLDAFYLLGLIVIDATDKTDTLDISTNETLLYQ